MKTEQAFGTWVSPITAELVTTAGVQLGVVFHCDGADFWSEIRPLEEGRCVIVKAVAGQEPVDLIGAPFNVRTRVHEYGGGSWWVDEQYLYFVHWDDQRLYRVSHMNPEEAQPVAITPPPGTRQGLRYADGCISPDKQWIVCVRESHELSDAQAVNDIVAIRNVPYDAQTKDGKSHNVLVVASGTDFYSTPRISPDGQRLSWIQWAHPQMPWDGTQLMLAELENNMALKDIRQIAGREDISIMGATWGTAAQLLYASDESGWWNVYQYNPVDTTQKALTHFTDREVGVPAWVFGTQRFVVLKNDMGSDQSSGNDIRLAMIVTHEAQDELMLLATDEFATEQTLSAVPLPYTAINSIAADQQGGVVVNGQPTTEPASIVRVNVDAATSTPSIQSLRAADANGIDKHNLSTAQAIEYASGDRQARAFFYPPTSQAFQGLPGELPPLIVIGHGGPTGHATAGLKLSIQYWTSRGIAVVDVNYGGSSGFGRDYRRLLRGQWGVVDVEDCTAVANYLAAENKVDARRMVIRGGSAGGLTVLRALQISGSFAAGTSLYGVADLELLAGDTHKFESRYLDGLLGGPYPEFQAVYKARSPINHTDELNCPILVLQGDEDKVVPPNQSAAIVDAVAAKGLAHAYVLFAGEQHGFRITENIIRALQIELWFYSKVLGFDTAEKIDAPPEAVGF